MKTPRWTLIGTLVLCAFFAAPAARAESPEKGAGDRKKWEQKHGEKIKEMRETLGLTPDQEAKLKAHREAHREGARALREEMRAKREAIRQELEKPSVDEARVHALNEEIKALEGKMSDHRLNGILEVRKILTPEQFKKFHELMPPPPGMGDGPGGKRQERRERRQERRGDE